MNGKGWATAWLVVQSLLLISAMTGVKFNVFHCALGVLCIVFNVFVIKVMRSRS